MHAIIILQKILRPVTELMDARNARTLFLAIDALVQGRRLTLMELARHFPGADYVHAPLKRLDRFLGNRAVHALRGSLYQVVTRCLLQGPHPVIVVDWSELKSDGCWHLLRAGIACRGRTLTLYEEVHPEAKKYHPTVEAAFLRKLKDLLPPGCRPILVTDAGFHTPWFRAVEALGWHWIGRIRHRYQIRLLSSTGSSPWQSRAMLCARATAQPRALGAAEITREKPLACVLTLVRQRAKGRRRYTRYGTRSRDGNDERMARSAKEPWLLASSRSLAHVSAAQVVGLYSKRMQIEQAFRDLKSHRYGCAFEDTLTRQPHRLEMLLLLHALASLLAWLVGVMESDCKFTTKQQMRRLRIYSIITRGWERLRRSADRLKPPDNDTWQQLRTLMVQLG